MEGEGFHRERRGKKRRTLYAAGCMSHCMSECACRLRSIVVCRRTNEPRTNSKTRAIAGVKEREGKTAGMEFVIERVKFIETRLERKTKENLMLTE